MIGINSIRKVVKNLLSSAEIDGYFTNHSLRRTSSTRMFQAGIDRKIVKEVTGHRSDAIDKYQITSDVQRKQVSDVIAKKPSIGSLNACESVSDVTFESDVSKDDEERRDFDVNVKRNLLNIPIESKVTVEGKEACSCNKTYNFEKNNLGDMLDSLLNGNNRTGNAKIKIEIEFTK